jgi:hypothetical protein
MEINIKKGLLEEVIKDLLLLVEELKIKIRSSKIKKLGYLIQSITD